MSRYIETAHRRHVAEPAEVAGGLQACPVALEPAKLAAKPAKAPAKALRAAPPS